MKVFQTKIFFYYSEQNIHPDFLGLAPLSSEIQYPRLFFSGICVFYFGATLPTKHLPWAEASAVPFPAHASFISEQHCPQKLCPGFESHRGMHYSIRQTACCWALFRRKTSSSFTLEHSVFVFHFKKLHWILLDIVKDQVPI